MAGCEDVDVAEGRGGSADDLEDVVDVDTETMRAQATSSSANNIGTESSNDQEKPPFAFSHCCNVKRKGTSAWTAECKLCGKMVRAS